MERLVFRVARGGQVGTVLCLVKPLSMHTVFSVAHVKVGAHGPNAKEIARGLGPDNAQEVDASSPLKRLVRATFVIKKKFSSMPMVDMTTIEFLF